MVAKLLLGIALVNLAFLFLKVFLNVIGVGLM